MLKRNSAILMLLFVIVIAPLCFSQQDDRFYQQADSVYRYQGIIPPIEFQYDLDEIFNKPLITNIPEEVLFDNNQSTIWLRTELMVSQSFYKSESNRFSPHFTSSLYEKYLEDSEFDMFRYVLGMAQTSAVAYMAYRHIKKYGFWK